MTALRAADDRDVFGLLPVAVAGIAQLERSAPLWGEHLEWVELVAGLRAFEERWGGIARLGGWSLTQLYGLDPVAPRARVGRMGGAFLACMPGRQVIDVDDKAIALVTRTASRLRIYRGDGDQEAVPAWELCRPHQTLLSPSM